MLSFNATQVTVVRSFFLCNAYCSKIFWQKKQAILTNDQQPRPNTELILAVAAASEWYKKLTKRQVSSLGELAAQEEITQGTITRNLPLALLKPAQVDKLLKGNHHPDLTIKMLLSDPTIL